MPEVTAQIEKDIAAVAQEIAEPKLIPTLAACQVDAVDRETESCIMCPYWAGLMEGGCCRSLYRTVTLSWGDWKAGRMSTKRYVHRLQTLHDYLVEKRKEVAECVKEVSVEDKINDVLGGKR